MKALSAILIWCLFSSMLCAGDDQSKILTLKKIESAIKLDGYMEPVWNQADSVSDFIQQEPYYAKEPSRRTVARLLTTPEALYCFITCFDEKQNIQQNKGKLDNLNGDFVALYLDTFGDKQTAYEFAVTAAGVRSDARMLDDARNTDHSWDGVWFAASQMYDWGYTVEMEIPYKSIQYNESLAEWGLDFARWTPTRAENDSWCQFEENEGQRVSKFGKIIFLDFKPSIKGLNLEIYPVAFGKATYLEEHQYKLEPTAGIDIFYNPSSKLTFQLTAYPDFAQIEADPYNFNISRYESYFNERRPFFTEGKEVFMASGRQRNSGFYKPLELFYSRRIGKKLPDGTEVPIITGTKAFGRIKDWEYGGFLALTGETDYKLDDTDMIEPRAAFASARLKKQILDNSSIGFLFVGKHTDSYDTGVLDLDGAFRTSGWQLSYQLARSFYNGKGDFGGSAGFTMFGEKWVTAVRSNYIGDKFDLDQVGFVPWRGTAELVGLTGPRWYFEQGYLKGLLLYFGPIINYEKVDQYVDRGGLIGLNMDFRNNWGYEINFVAYQAKDLNIKYDAYEITASSWMNISPKWRGNFYTGYEKTYNFNRNYLSFYSWFGTELEWNALTTLEVGTSYDMYIEGDPDHNIADITYNARPFVSLTPINNLNLRLYVDNLYLRSTRQMERIIIGFLFSYNFSPKSWLYLAVNEFHNRTDQYDTMGNYTSRPMQLTEQVGVLKVRYLYYF